LATDAALRCAEATPDKLPGPLILIKAGRRPAGDNQIVPVGGFGAMIICSCNVLSDHDVRSVVVAPDAPRTAAQVHRCLGCSPECGRCTPTIRQIVAAAAPRDGVQR
jgi:bacterioferritin-associated ferredoxin